MEHFGIYVDLVGHRGSFKGDVVLDPFMGSGSTALAAKKAGRSYIGYDISQEYVELAEQRLADD